MSAGQQQLVAVGGAGLIAADFWLGPNRKVIAAGMFQSGATKAQQRVAHDALKKMSGGVLFLMVAVILAGVSNNLGRVMSYIVGGLILLWSVNYYRTGHTIIDPNNDGGVGTGLGAELPGGANSKPVKTPRGVVTDPKTGKPYSGPVADLPTHPLDPGYGS